MGHIRGTSMATEHALSGQETLRGPRKVRHAMSDKESQADQDQPITTGHLILVALCAIVLLGVLWCALHFNLYAT